MAGRIRSIKPEMIEDAVTAGLTHEAFRLFLGMILVADDHGNLRASPAWLVGQVFHGRANVTPIAELCAELGAKLVTFYTADGQEYAHLNGWQKHQRIDNAGEPRVPLPPGWTVRREERPNGSRTRIRWVSERATEDFREPPRTSANLREPPKSSDTAPNQNQPVEAATAGSRSRSPITTSEGEAAVAPPPATPTLAELAVGRSMYAAPYVTDDDVAATAARIDRSLAAEPKAAKHDKRAIVSDAVTKARSHRARYPSSTPEQVLAKVEEAVSWILSDIRSGKRVASVVRGAAVTDDFAADAVEDMRRTEREARDRSRAGTGTAAAGDLFASLGKGAA